MVPWWWLVVVGAAGLALGWGASALVIVWSGFREIEREIEAANAELDARIKSGCRRIVPPQGGSGTAPPPRT